jgi:hypothetical protein
MAQRTGTVFMVMAETRRGICQVGLAFLTKPEAVAAMAQIQERPGYTTTKLRVYEIR